MATAAPLAGRIISIGGGKGGVGKSVVAANLAVAMARSGASTLLVDADLGSANLHTLFNLQRVDKTLNDLFEHRIESLAEAAIEVGVPNLKLIPGSSALAGAANINHGQKLRLVRQIQALEADVVVIDVGAGVSFNTIDLFNAADFRLLVVTPQLTSIQNAYGFLKGAIFRIARLLAAQLGQDAAFEGAGETQKLPDIVRVIQAQEPETAAALKEVLLHFGARAIGNNVFDAAQRNSFFAVSRMVLDFLGTPLPILGALRASRAVHDSVSNRRPFALEAVAGENGKELERIARALLQEDPAPARQVRRGLADPEEWIKALTPSETDAPLPAALRSYDRISPRLPADFAGLLWVDGSQHPVRIEDVSLTGVRISGALSLRLNQTCELSVPAMEDPAENTAPQTAIVRHTDGRTVAGLEFLGVGTLPEKLVAAATANPPGLNRR